MERYQIGFVLLKLSRILTKLFHQLTTYDLALLYTTKCLANFQRNSNALTLSQPFRARYMSVLRRILQTYFIYYDNHSNAEPIGYKAPSMGNKAESTTFKHAVNTTFVLLCECQAFPVAIFRYFEFFTDEININRFSLFRVS